VFVTGANDQHTFNVSHANAIFIQSLCGSCGTGVGPPCVFTSSGGASIYTDDTASSGFVPYSIWEAYAGYVYPGNHIFNAGNSCVYVIASFFGGFLGLQQNKSFTFLGSFSLNSSGQFCSTISNGTIEIPVPGQTVFVNPGFVTGYKYAAVLNGVIVTQGLGPSYFPGTIAGFTNTGGQYN
jgi:hypothetical protein